MLSQKSYVLKCKELSQTCGQVWGAFANTKAYLINITVGSEGQVLNCSHVLLKTQFCPLINQGRLPFATPKPFDKLIAKKTTQK